MEDFYNLIEHALENDYIDKLVQDYKGDSTLTYSISSEVVTIPNNVFSGKNSLENISNKSKGRYEYTQENGKIGKYLAIEIAFAGIFDEKNLNLKEILIGGVGNQTACFWEDGKLLKNSYRKAKESGLKVILNHTHPVIQRNEGEIRNYGALPSWVPYECEEDFNNYVKDEKIKNMLKNSGLCEKYGADYCEILVRSKNVKNTSNFAMIMSPRLNQLGIFQLKEEGQIIYHPWKIV